MEKFGSFVRRVVMAMQCWSWQLAKELDEGHRRLVANSVWLGRRRQEDGDK